MKELPHLHWFPKPFGAGDTDGTGAQRVLGRPDIELASLLVRETAQNSWDARLRGLVPSFDIRFRIIDEMTREVLRWNIFHESAPNLGLKDALDRPVLTAVEICDRRTRGLGGPTRNDIEPLSGETTDYADFILTIGAPPDQSHGGGTYGFGKTASYLASTCSTILVWSRSRDPRGTIIERLVGSAMGPTFVMDGQRFTGRQWWGVDGPTEHGGGVFQVQPAEGVSAAQLGKELFERGFDEDETGTSILILQPDGSEDPDALVDSWARAITENLWPKMGETHEERRRMEVALHYNGVKVNLTGEHQSPVLRAKIECLEAVRRRQSGAVDDHPLIRVEEIHCRRPKQLLGHLALMRVFGVSDDDPMFGTSNTVTYMRHEAELVVRAEGFNWAPDSIGRWVGVFKPTVEVDDAFASAEPPAHDLWSPQGLTDRRSKTFVNVGLREIRDRTSQFLKPNEVGVNGDTSAPTGALSAALAGLAGSAPGSRATPRTRGRRAASARSQRRARPKVEVLEVTPLPQADDRIRSGRQATRIALQVTGTRAVVDVQASDLAVAVDGGRIAADGLVALEAWTTDSGTTDHGSSIRAVPGRTFYADISYPEGIAIEFDFVAKESK